MEAKKNKSAFELETRGYRRVEIQHQARFTFKGGTSGWNECIIINISVNGAGMEFYTDETVDVNSKLFLEILPPDDEETITAGGIIRWVKHGEKDCVYGIELTEKLNEVKKAMLKV